MKRWRGIAPSKNEEKPIQKQKVTYKYTNEEKPKSLDEKVKDLEDQGLVEDVSQKKQALMDNIKDFTLSLTGNDLDKSKVNRCTSTWRTSY